MRRKLPLLFLALTIWASSFGQGDLNDLLKGSQADANYLAQGYLDPVLSAIGSGLNQGWYNTAANHKKFGFDLTISVSSIQFPADNKTFHVDNSKLASIQLEGPGGSVVAGGDVPTVIGPETPSTYHYTANPTSTFQGPPGLDLENQVPLGGFPLPMVNLGIGIPWNTDVKFRYGSANPSGGTKINLFGFAIQHDIKQHIPGLKELPFDLSALFGYTTFSTEVAFDEIAHPDQKGMADFSATTIQAIIGKKLSVLTVYGSVGYNFSSGTFKAKGVYDTGDGTGTTMTDPVNISSSVNGPRATAGVRLKLAVFTFHGDYTFQRYNTITLGFGISVR